MYNECLYATRDSFGNRPLAYGLLVPPPNAGDIGSIPWDLAENCFVEGWCISSESCPFPSVHAKLKRDVEPGEIIKFERNRLPKTLAIMPRPQLNEPPAFCIFEYVYFARPDSIIEKQTVYAVRKLCGQRLARESPIVKRDEDKKNFIVAPVPESSIPAALGYSEESGIPYVEVFCKNRYVGRTFIQPSMRLRRLGVAKKFGPLTTNFVGKSIILIDDSIVRGTTIAQLVRLLREAGAKEVHIRIASPPLIHPCYMGINIPTSEELIANHLSAESLSLTLGASSLKYLSIKGLRESVQSRIIENLIADRKRALASEESGENRENLILPRKGHLMMAPNRRYSIDKEQQEALDLVEGKNASIFPTTTNNSNGKNGIENGDIKKLELANDNETKIMTEECKEKEVKKKLTDLDSNIKLETENENKPVVSDEEIRTKVGHCDACLTGKYPVELDEEMF